MRAALQLLRGLFKNIARRVMSRIVGRAYGGSAGQGGSAFGAFKEPMEGLLEAGLGLMELLELIAEIYQIIEAVRDAAASESVNVIMSVFNRMNEGQQTLLDEFVFDYIDEYFHSVSEPDFDEFTYEIYSKHPAIQQALSGTIEHAYAAGVAAGKDAFYDGLVSVLGEEVLSRATDILAGRKSLFDMESSYANMRESWNDFSFIPKHVRASMYWRPITNPKFFLLPDHPNAPFWLKAEGIGTHARMTGQWTYEQSMAYREYLFRATADDPMRRTAPPGFKVPYSIDLRGTQWESQINVPHQHQSVYESLNKPNTWSFYD